MKLKNKFYSVLFIAFVAFTANAQDKIREYVPADKILYDQIESMDKVFFDAYNSCDLKKQESIYSDTIEFFHRSAKSLTLRMRLSVCDWHKIRP
jgi:hypothetical protein